MKQNATWVTGFVGMIFVPEFRAWVTGLREDCKLRTQLVDLEGIEDLWAGQIAVFIKGEDLFFGQQPRGAVCILRGEEVAEREMCEREIARGWRVHSCQGGGRESWKSKLFLNPNTNATVFHLTAVAFESNWAGRRQFEGFFEDFAVTSAAG